MPVKVVAHPATGAVITPSVKNPLWGTFRVDTENVSMENGIFNKSKRSAFIRGKIEDLNAAGLTVGKVLPGKIIKRESFEPFYEGQPAKINPSNGETVLTNGMETYIEFVYTQEANATDYWVDQEPAVIDEEAKKQIENQAV